MARQIATVTSILLVGVIALCVGAFDGGVVNVERAVREDLPYTLLLSTASLLALWGGLSERRLAIRLWVFLAGTAILLLCARGIVPRLYYNYYVDVGTIHAVVTVLVCLIWRGIRAPRWKDFFGNFYVRDLLMWMAGVAVLITVCQVLGRNIEFRPGRWDRAVMLRGVFFALVPLAVASVFGTCRHLVIRAGLLICIIPAIGALISSANWIERWFSRDVFTYLNWFIGLTGAQAAILAGVLTLTGFLSVEKDQRSDGREREAAACDND